MAHDKIIFLVGGRSTEKDASLHSYQFLRQSLIDDGGRKGPDLASVIYLPGDGTFLAHRCKKIEDYPATEIELMKGKVAPLSELVQYLLELRGHIFSILHGNEGEDGAFQGLAEIFDLTGNFGPIHASCVGMNKYIQALVAEKICADLSPIPSEIVDLRGSPYDISQIIQRIGGCPIIVKPNRMGASLHLYSFDLLLEEQVVNAFKEIKKYDDFALVQKKIIGREMTCGIYQDGSHIHVLPIIEAKTASGVLGHDEKHQKGRIEAIIHTNPSESDIWALEIIGRVSLELFKFMQCVDMCRFDFILGNDGNVYFLEANTMPGLMAGSAYPRMLNAIGLSVIDLLCASIKNARVSNDRSKNLRYRIED